MPDTKRHLLLSPLMIRNMGIALFILSFLAPPRWRGGADFHLFGGCGAFIETPAVAFQALLANRDEAPSHPVLLFLVMMAAWSANFTIFAKRSRIVAWIAIFSPWPAF